MTWEVLCSVLPEDWAAAYLETDSWAPIASAQIASCLILSQMDNSNMKIETDK